MTPFTCRAARPTTRICHTPSLRSARQAARRDTLVAAARPPKTSAARSTSTCCQANAVQVIRQQSSKSTGRDANRVTIKPAESAGFCRKYRDQAQMLCYSKQWQRSFKLTSLLLCTNTHIHTHTHTHTRTHTHTHTHIHRHTCMSVSEEENGTSGVLGEQRPSMMEETQRPNFILRP
jgi:hypothetical protein